MSKNLLIVLCLAMAFAFGIGNVAMADTTNWIVTADKTTVVNNNADGLNFQITLLDANGAVDTAGAPSSIQYRVYAYSEQGFVTGEDTAGLNAVYNPTVTGTFTGTTPSMDYGTFWCEGQTVAEKGHSAFVRTKGGLAGFNMYFENTFTGTATVTLKLEKITAPTTSGGVDVTTLQTKTVTCTVTAGSTTVTKVRIESFTKSAQDTNGASDAALPVDVAKCQLGKISGSTAVVKLYKDSSYLTCSEASAYTGTVYLTLTGYNPSNPLLGSASVACTGDVVDATLVSINGIDFEFSTDNVAAAGTEIVVNLQNRLVYKHQAMAALAEAVNACTLTTGTFRTGDIFNEYIRAVFTDDFNGNGTKDDPAVLLYAEGSGTSAITLTTTSGVCTLSGATFGAGQPSWVDAAYNNATGNTFTFSGTLNDPSQGCTISIGDTDKDGKVVNKAGWYWVRAYVTIGSTNVYSQAGLDKMLILPKDVASATKMSLILDKTYVHKDKDQLDPVTGTSYINSGWAFLDDADGNHCRFDTTNSGNVTAQITIPTGSTGITSPTSVTFDKRAPRKSFTLASSGADLTTGAMTLTLADTAVTNPLTSGTVSMTVTDIGVSGRFATAMKATTTLYKSVLVGSTTANDDALELYKDDGDGLPLPSGAKNGKVVIRSATIMADAATVTVTNGNPAGGNVVFTARTAAATVDYTIGDFDLHATMSTQAEHLARAINSVNTAASIGLLATVSGTDVTIYAKDITVGGGVTVTAGTAGDWTDTGATDINGGGAEAFVALTTADTLLDSTAAMTMTMEWFENYRSQGSMTGTVTANQAGVDLLFSKSFYPDGIVVKSGGRIWGNFVKIKVATSATTYGECIIPMYGTVAATNKKMFLAGATTAFGGGNALNGWGITSPVGRGTPTALQYVDGLGTQITALTFGSVTETGSTDNVYYVINGADSVFTVTGGHNKLAVDWNGFNGATATRSWQQLTSYFRLVDANGEEVHAKTANANTAENDADRLGVSSSRGATITYYADSATNSTTFCSTKVDNATALAHLYSGVPNKGYSVKLKYATTDVGSTDTVTLTPTTQGPTPLELKITVAATKTLTSINATAARTSILKNDENVVRVEALDQFGQQIDPASANAIYLTYDTSKGSIYNYARNATAPGRGTGSLQYTNGTFTQVYTSGTTTKPLVYMSYQAGGTTGTVQLTFEDAAKTSTKKKVVSFTITDVPGTTETTSVKYLPYLMADNSWDCYIAIQNYGTAEAKHDATTPKTLSLTAYDKSGVVIGSAYTGATIAANGMALLDARTIFGATPTDGTMMVKITMNNAYTLKIMGIMTNKSIAEKSNFMLEDAVSASGQTIVVPEVIDATNYKTTLVIGNAGTTSESVTVTGKDSAAVSYSATATIAGNGFSAQDVTAWFASPSFAGKEGWAKATATNNSLIGAVIYTNATSSRNTKGLVSLSTVTRSGSLSAYIPMAVYTENFVTPRLMLANNSGSAVDVTVKAVKQDGTDFGTAKTTNVAANGYAVADLNSTYFTSTDTMPTYFTLKITSASTEVYAMVAYLFSTSYTKSAGDFVIASPLDSTSTSALNIPFFLTLTPYQSYLFVQNTGTASNSVTITAYSTSGTSAGTTTKSIGANAMEFFVVNGIAANTYGAVKVTGGSGILCTSVLAYGDGTKEVWGGFSIGN